MWTGFVDCMTGTKRFTGPAIYAVFNNSICHLLYAVLRVSATVLSANPCSIISVYTEAMASSIVSMACSPFGYMPACSRMDHGSIPIFEHNTASHPSRARIILSRVLSVSAQLSWPLQYSSTFRCPMNRTSIGDAS